MQLSPRESFTIVRQLEDHTDSSTYYVRAVIRNAKTDALLDTVNLTDRGSRRFSASWLVPADASGQGYYISILTTVYTDSGYTTKSESYGEKMETYLVAERMNPNLGGVGGGPDIDYKKIRSIIEEVISEKVKIPKQQKIEIPPYPSLEPIVKAINRVNDAVAAIEMPETDLKPLESLVRASAQDVGASVETGMDAIRALVSGIGDTVSEAADRIARIGREVDATGAKVSARIAEEIGKTTEALESRISELNLVELKVSGKKEVGPKTDQRINRLLKK